MKWDSVFLDSETKLVAGRDLFSGSIWIFGGTCGPRGALFVDIAGVGVDVRDKEGVPGAGGINGK